MPLFAKSWPNHLFDNGLILHEQRSYRVDRPVRLITHSQSRTCHTVGSAGIVVTVSVGTGCTHSRRGRVPTNLYGKLSPLAMCGENAQSASQFDF